MVAELCAQTSCGVDDIALDALREVQPGGHFFGAAHTMERYQTAFYEPMAGDWSNFGTWTERGGKDASERATGTWQSILNDFTAPELDGGRVEQLMASIERRTAAGGAEPES